MAKKRKKSSYKGLGILDGLIDLAGGAAMNVVANRMEEKYHYTAKGKINPYRVSAIGLASGRLKTTEQIMRTGTWLGAKGSFDVTSDPPGSTWDDGDDSLVYSDDPLLNAIADTVENDNRYAWRFNCEDGSAYGVFPEDYETREEYHQALNDAKMMDGWDTNTSDEAASEQATYPVPEQEEEAGAYCAVSRLDNGQTETHWIDRAGIKVGDIVEFLDEYQMVHGVVVSIEKPQDD